MSDKIRIKFIHPNPNNPRLEAGDISDLAQSIRSDGLLEPPLVRPAIFGEVTYVGPYSQFIIEDGYRRWVACRHVFGEDASMDVHIVHPPENADLLTRALTIGLITDIHKVHLGPMERARTYGRMRDELGMSLSEIARAVGITASSVSNSMLLLQLSPASQKRVIAGTLKIKDAEQAVKDSRTRDRAKLGKQQIDVGWEPEFFTKNHILAKLAKTMCDAREHGKRRRLGGIACGNCWELVIRQDQTKVVRAELAEAGVITPPATFLQPFMVPNDSASIHNGSEKRHVK
jgi:ParB family chromosome partitioning protein